MNLSQLARALVNVSGVAAALTSFACNPVSAQLVLEFGDPATLLPVSNFQINANETVNIALLVHNPDGNARVSGYTVELGIGGGGVALGGIAGPTFTAVDMVTGTLFASDHGTPTINGGPDPFPVLGSVPQYLGLSLTTTHAAVPPETVGAVDLPSGDSLLATLTVSAAGLTGAGVWNLALVGAGTASFLNDANNNLLIPTFQNSTITLVPEPQLYGWIAGLTLAAFAGARRIWTKR